ncbi:MAG: hypothetical protein ABIN37_06300 [Burkholderiaceae bacterium]
MNTFVQPNHPAEHQGVMRLEKAAHFLGRIGRRLGRARNLVSLLLAGGLSALVVVADQIVNTWDDGRLLLAWVALWSVLFAAIALSAELVFGWYARLKSAWKAQSVAAAQRAADVQTWRIAQTDPRLMAELQAARLRAESLALEAGEALPDWPFAHAPTHRPVRRYWP